MIQQAIERIVSGLSLSREETAEVMNEIMSGRATPAQFGAFVTGMRIKGETSEELVGMVQTMRAKSLHVKSVGQLVDTCGTGGDASGTFNISTTASFVLAGAGVKVAKHGNRAMSGACGSADVLEELGAKIDLNPEGVQRCLEEVCFGFMFAQIFHPSMKFAALPRREIGIRTVFNMLGPLTNPAGATSQLIGVADPSVGVIMAEALRLLDSVHALIVHGTDGMDEISLASPTQIWELKDGDVTEYSITADELGLKAGSSEDFKVSNVEESVAVLRAVLEGRPGSSREIVLANAGAALYAVDRVASIKEGVELAAESIDNGNAKGRLDAFVDLSQRLQ